MGARIELEIDEQRLAALSLKMVTGPSCGVQVKSSVLWQLIQSLLLSHAYLLKAYREKLPGCP